MFLNGSLVQGSRAESVSDPSFLSSLVVFFYLVTRRAHHFITMVTLFFFGMHTSPLQKWIQLD